MTRQVPHKRVLKVLDEQFGGQVIAVGRDDIVKKIALALGERSSGDVLLYKTLKQMEEEGKIELRYKDRRVDRIALPGVEEPYNPTQDQASSQEETEEGPDMVAPRRRHNTTSPRDAQGAPLPYVLGDDQVGELQVSYTDPEVEGEIVTAAELVLDQLRSYTKKTIRRSEMIAMIVALLTELGHTPASAKTLSMPVLGRMCRIEWLAVYRKLEKEKDTIFSINLPVAETPAPPKADEQPLDLGQMTPRDAIVALVKKVETLRQAATTTGAEKEELKRQCDELHLKLAGYDELKANHAKLQKDLETARAEAAAKPQVDERVVKKLADKIQELKGKIGQLEEAATEASKRHREEMQRLKTTHSRTTMERDEAHKREIQRLESKLETTRREASELQQQLDAAQKAPAESAMSTDLLDVVNSALAD